MDIANQLIDADKAKKKGIKKGIFIGAGATLIIVFIVLAIMIKTGKAIALTSSDEIIDNATIAKANEIMQLIDKEYLNDYDKDEIRDKIIAGLVSGLDDEYSVYYNTDDAQDLLDTTSGEFEGIGVVIQENTDGTVSVNEVYKNGPAYKAGIKADDIISKVDGESVEGKTVSDVAALVKGEKGTQVTVTVIRDGKSIDCTATRDTITTITATGTVIDNIGYIEMTMFSDTTPDQFKEALDDLLNQNVNGIVIDLRDNPGGTVSSCQEILDDLLPEGVILQVKDKNGNEEDLKTTGSDKIDVPIVVLINENSASASEIFAGAMQDRKAATIIGTTSYGKGVMQQITKLSDGSYLKFTTNEFFTPNGNKINKVGIKPDIEITDSNPDDDTDEILNKAMEVIKSK